MSEQYPSDQYVDLPKQDKLYCLAHKAIKSKENKVTYCLEEDMFYVYNNGTWEKMFDIQIMRMIGDILPEFYKYDIATRKKIVENLKVIDYSSVLTFNLIDMLNLKNCMLNVYSGETFEHDPKYRFTIQINYDYDSSAQCPLWKKTLNEIFEFDNDKISILQEFFGYCLTRETKLEKALLLLGDSRSGKSTILNTLRALVGDNNCSSVPFSHIAHQQQNFAMLGKLINMDTDVSSKAIDFEAEFKKITSGEDIQTNPKYVAPFSFKPFCKMVLSANDFPRITDHSSAFYKRLILIPCDRVFEPHEQNVNLKNELIAELPGILNWAIIGLRRLINRKSFEKKEFMDEAISDLREESNPVDGFFNEHVSVEVGEHIEIEKSELYSKYKIWASNSNHGTLSISKFSQHVFRKYAKSTFKDSRNAITKRRVWRNIVYKDTKSINSNQGWTE